MAESYNICLDIGGTKTLGAVFDSSGSIVFRLKKKRRGRTERWLGPLLLVNAAVFAVSLLL